MLKKDELANPNSCLNKAADDELVFVLRAHDVTAPSTLRYWASKRVAMGKNKSGDPEIQEALDCADRMERQRELGA